jgi:hypothetical protein
MQYSIVKSIVHIECELEVITDFTLEYAHSISFYQVRGIVDAAAFSDGVGRRLILDSCVLPGAALPQPLLSKSPYLGTLCTLNAQEIVDLTDKERKILKPLNDLIETLMFPLESYVNCGRALDGLCRLISADKDRQKRWIALRDNLNVSKDYVHFISNLSTGPRHGETGPVNITTVSEVRVRSWRIMNRFLLFRKGGNVPLREPEFPLL